jgi:ubiquinol-cytochrome c reductase cytochrome b/c1 subunit
MRISKVLGANIANNHIIAYPTPAIINYFWGFGGISIFFYSIQLITGLILSVNYGAETSIAYLSIEHIMRNVNYGWLIRYMHANGASFFFLAVYLHISKNFFFKLYKNKNTWNAGLLIFLAIMATAFLGYVLPWGQMSFWGATVITNLFSAIPYVGKYFTIWLWGGFSVDNPTLKRFFILHFLLPFVVLGLITLHISALHMSGSTTQLEKLYYKDYRRFLHYFGVKDMVCILLIVFVYFYFVFFDPNKLGHADNYIPANPLVTQDHIVPEWYFLPFYAILRAIPNKIEGIVLMFLSIVCLALLPFSVNKNWVHKTAKTCKIENILFWFFITVVYVLGCLGAFAVEPYCIFFSQVYTVFYFGYLFYLFIYPIYGLTTLRKWVFWL